MRFLLDTHTFIWWDSQFERLSEKAKTLCQDPENEIFLSVGSLWEIQIKVQLDRILIAQAKVENFSLISNDEVMKKYPIIVEW